MMKRRYRIMSIFMILPILLGAVGCGDKKDTEADTVNMVSAEPTPTSAPEAMTETETELKGKEMDYYMSILRNVDSRSESGKYVLYDLDKDGVQELIVSSGTFEGDWSNDVYTISSQAVSQIGSFSSTVSLYEAEDGNGLFGVHGHMGLETIYQITKTGSQLGVSTFSEREVSVEEDYYSNDKAIPWINISDIVGGSEEKDTAIQSGNPNGGVEEYILPNSSTSYLTDGEISSLTDDELQMAINEIYARHGRRFQDSGIQSYFDGKSWYSGTIDADSFDESVLSDVELSNIQVLSAYRDSSSAAYSSTENDYGNHPYKYLEGTYSNYDTGVSFTLNIYDQSSQYNGVISIGTATFVWSDGTSSSEFCLSESTYGSGNFIVSSRLGQGKTTMQFYDTGNCELSATFPFNPENDGIYYKQ